MTLVPLYKFLFFFLAHTSSNLVYTSFGFLKFILEIFLANNLILLN